jgi:hypothetical protein
MVMRMMVKKIKSNQRKVKRRRSEVRGDEMFFFSYHFAHSWQVVGVNHSLSLTLLPIASASPSSCTVWFYHLRHWMSEWVKKEMKWIFIIFLFLSFHFNYDAFVLISLSLIKLSFGEMKWNEIEPLSTVIRHWNGSCL